MDLFFRTSVPIILLIGLGFLSRRLGVFKSGDEKILSGYVYYFALPSLFFINISQTVFNKETLKFMLAGSIPIFIVIALLTLLYLIFRFSKDVLYLLIISCAFGSYAFFGIPFVMFAFPGAEGEAVAALSSGTLSVVGIITSLSILEIQSLKSKGLNSVKEGLKHVFTRLTTNPLIISILLGVIVSLGGLKIPFPLIRPIHMLGETTATVAIFMLGVFFYGRKYKQIGRAFALSIFRIALLPMIALITVSFFTMPGLQKSVIILMNSMPAAVSLIVLSQKYNFYKDTIASLILITSLSAGIHLNIWLLVLGYH